MMRSYLETPELGELIPSREYFAEFESWLMSADAHEMEHSALEEQLETRGRELQRRLYQAHLDRRWSQEARLEGVLGSDGIRRTHVRSSSRPLMTSFGEVVVRRFAYGQPGVHSLFPADAALNLPVEKHSHGLRRRAAEQASRESFDEVVTTIGQNTGAKLAKRQAEQLARDSAVDFDSFYASRALRDQEDAEEILVLTTDGKGVVMRRQDLRPATRQSAEKSTHKLRCRLSRGEKKNRKRMATVASVYSVSPFERSAEQVMCGLAPTNEPRPKRPKPHNKRVWASLEKEPSEVINDMFDEALMRDPNQHRTWIALVDGAQHQLDVLTSIATERELDLEIVLDFIHVLEYLWKAAWAFFEEGDADAEKWVSERALRILNGEVSQVAAGIRRSATRRGTTGNKRAQIDTTCEYLLKYKELMRYDLALAQGWPIATGVIEGACRYLIKDRMDITGARWSLNGAEAVLRLRAIRTSGDFNQYWNFHKQQELCRNHTGKFPKLRCA